MSLGIRDDQIQIKVELNKKVKFKKQDTYILGKSNEKHVPQIILS